MRRRLGSRRTALIVLRWLTVGSIPVCALLAGCSASNVASAPTVTQSQLTGTWKATSWNGKPLPFSFTCIEASGDIPAGSVWTDTVTDYRIVMRPDLTFTATVAEAHPRSDLGPTDVIAGTYAVSGNHVLFAGVRVAYNAPSPFGLDYASGTLSGNLVYPRCSSNTPGGLPDWPVVFTQ